MRKSPAFSASAQPENLPTRRLAVWQLTGIFAAGACLPSRLAIAQGAAGTLAEQDNIAIKRELGGVARRTDVLLRQTVEDGVEQPARAVTRFKSEEQKISTDLSVLFNERISEDKWAPLVTASQVDLAIGLQNRKIRLAPTPAEVMESIKRPLPEVKPASTEDALNVLLTILLDAFGIRELGTGLVDLLLGDTPIKEALTQLRRALKGKHYGQAALELERLLALIVSPRIIQLVGVKFGVKNVELVLRRIIVRFVPFIGWGYMATCLLVSIYHNRENIERLL